MSRTIKGVELFTRTVVDGQPSPYGPQCQPIPWRPHIVQDVAGSKRLRIGILDGAGHLSASTAYSQCHHRSHGSSRKSRPRDSTLESRHQARCRAHSAGLPLGDKAPNTQRDNARKCMAENRTRVAVLGQSKKSVLGSKSPSCIISSIISECT